MSRVAPVAVTAGGKLIDVSSGNPVWPLGGGTQVDDNLGNTMLEQSLALLPAANCATIRVTPDTYVPNRPTGGDPCPGTGLLPSFTTMVFDPTYEARLIAMMDACQAAHRDFFENPEARPHGGHQVADGVRGSNVQGSARPPAIPA